MYSKMWTKRHKSWTPTQCFLLCLLVTQICMVTTEVIEDKSWEDNEVRAHGMPKITGLEVRCGKKHMTVEMSFSGQFNGIVYSKGGYGDEKCAYVYPNTGIKHVTFDIYYDRCGTNSDLHEQYFENTVIIQYEKDIIELWDEARKIKCEWHDSYEKQAVKPSIKVADLDVVKQDFIGDKIGCWLEIQTGKGPWSNQVSGIVRIGQKMTMVVAIHDEYGQFDMRVKSCIAHNGNKYENPLQLTDEHGCILKTKLMSPFKKIKVDEGKATVISYAYFSAFKFPDKVDVQIECKVEVCRYGCPEHCDKSDYQQPESNSYGYESRNKEQTVQVNYPPPPNLKENIVEHGYDQPQPSEVDVEQSEPDFTEDYGKHLQEVVDDDIEDGGVEVHDVPVHQEDQGYFEEQNDEIYVEPPLEIVHNEPEVASIEAYEPKNVPQEVPQQEYQPNNHIQFEVNHKIQHNAEEQKPPRRRGPPHGVRNERPPIRQRFPERRFPQRQPNHRRGPHPNIRNQQERRPEGDRFSKNFRRRPHHEPTNQFSHIVAETVINPQYAANQKRLPQPQAHYDQLPHERNNRYGQRRRGHPGHGEFPKGPRFLHKRGAEAESQTVLGVSKGFQVITDSDIANEFEGEFVVESSSRLEGVDGVCIQWSGFIAGTVGLLILVIASVTSTAILYNRYGVKRTKKIENPKIPISFIPNAYMTSRA